MYEEKNEFNGIILTFREWLHELEDVLTDMGANKDFLAHPKYYKEKYFDKSVEVKAVTIKYALGKIDNIISFVYNKYKVDITELIGKED